MHSIASFCDDNAFYLDDRLIVHCVSLMMGIEDIYEIVDEDAKKILIDRFQNDFRLAQKMIKESAGIHQIERLFSSINKPKLHSNIIGYYVRLKKRQS